MKKVCIFAVAGMIDEKGFFIVRLEFSKDIMLVETPQKGSIIRFDFKASKTQAEKNFGYKKESISFRIKEIVFIENREYPTVEVFSPEHAETYKDLVEKNNLDFVIDKKSIRFFKENGWNILPTGVPLGSFDF